MRFSVAAVVLASAGYVAAASCPDQTVIDACVSSTKAALSHCTDTDKDCVCTAWTSVVACYNSCPDNVDLAPAQAQQAANCGEADHPKSDKAAATTPVIGSISSYVSSSLKSEASSLAAKGSTMSSMASMSMSSLMTSGASSSSASASAAATSASASTSKSSASATKASAASGSSSTSSKSSTGVAATMGPGGMMALVGAGLALAL